MNNDFHNPKKPVIGVFDSGMGGMGILRQIHILAPHLSTVYLADTARVPYGSHSAQTIVEYAKNCVSILNHYNLSCLVIACNTVSSVALECVQAHCKVPVIDMVSQTCSQIVQTKARKVAVLATKRTVLSGAYEKTLAQLNFQGELQSIACPLLVPMIEEGIINGPLAKLIVAHYLKELTPNTQVIALGCTHYLALAPIIKELLPSVELIDCGELTAMKLNELYPLEILVNTEIQQSVAPLDRGPAVQQPGGCLRMNGNNNLTSPRLLHSRPPIKGGIVQTSSPSALCQQPPIQGGNRIPARHYLVTEDPNGFIRLAKQLYGYDLCEKHVKLIQSDVECTPQKT